jgi:maltose O-acetyltransferase
MHSGKSEKEKMLAGELYRANDPELVAERKRAKVLCQRYSQQVEHLDHETLTELLESSTDAYLEPPSIASMDEISTLGKL